MYGGHSSARSDTGSHMSGGRDTAASSHSHSKDPYTSLKYNALTKGVVAFTHNCSTYGNHEYDFVDFPTMQTILGRTSSAASLAATAAAAAAAAPPPPASPCTSSSVVSSSVSMQTNPNIPPTAPVRTIHESICKYLVWDACPPARTHAFDNFSSFRQHVLPNCIWKEPPVPMRFGGPAPGPPPVVCAGGHFPATVEPRTCITPLGLFTMNPHGSTESVTAAPPTSTDTTTVMGHVLPGAPQGTGTVMGQIVPGMEKTTTTVTTPAGGDAAGLVNVFPSQPHGTTAGNSLDTLGTGKSLQTPDHNQPSSAPMSMTSPTTLTPAAVSHHGGGGSGRGNHRDPTSAFNAIHQTYHPQAHVREDCIAFVLHYHNSSREMDATFRPYNSIGVCFMIPMTKNDETESATVGGIQKGLLDPYGGSVTRTTLQPSKFTESKEMDLIRQLREEIQDPVKVSMIKSILIRASLHNDIGADPVPVRGCGIPNEVTLPVVLDQILRVMNGVNKPIFKTSSSSSSSRSGAAGGDSASREFSSGRSGRDTTLMPRQGPASSGDYHRATGIINDSIAVGRGDGGESMNETAKAVAKAAQYAGWVAIVQKRSSVVYCRHPDDSNTVMKHAPRILPMGTARRMYYVTLDLPGEKTSTSSGSSSSLSGPSSPTPSSHLSNVFSKERWETMQIILGSEAVKEWGTFLMTPLRRATGKITAPRGANNVAAGAPATGPPTEITDQVLEFKRSGLEPFVEWCDDIEASLGAPDDYIRSFQDLVGSGLPDSTLSFAKAAYLKAGTKRLPTQRLAPETTNLLLTASRFYGGDDIKGVNGF